MYYIKSLLLIVLLIILSLQGIMMIPGNPLSGLCQLAGRTSTCLLASPHGSASACKAGHCPEAMACSSK